MINPRTHGLEHEEEIARAASELKWRQTLLTQHLKTLRQCISPRRSRRMFYDLSVQGRADLAEELLARIAQDVGGLLRQVNEVRQTAKRYVAEARDEKNCRVLLGD